MEAPDVDITMMDVLPDGRLMLRLNGRTGKTTPVHLEIGGKALDCVVPPYGILTETL